jgi:hypothetical protein
LTPDIEDMVSYLRQSNAASLPHWGEDLLSHLLGSYMLLETWGCRQELCIAGLFHSIYGTERFHHKPVDFQERQSVRGLIGEEAEQLAFYFSVLKRSSLFQNLDRETDFQIENRLTGEFYNLSETVLADLYHIALANWLEQRPRMPQKRRYRRMKDFIRLTPHLNPAAQLALNQASRMQRLLAL